MGVMRKLSIAGVMAVATTTGALATDLYVPTEQPALTAPDEGTDWSGLYLGKFALINWARERNPIFSPPDAVFGVGKVVGYNWDLGQVILGVEGVVGYYWPQTDSGIWGDVANQVLLEGNVRAGIEVGDNGLIYVLAGVGTLHRLPSYTGFGPDTLNFGTVGVGGELMFGNGWAGRAQYNYRAFADPWSDFYSHNVSIGVVKYIK
jgi:opacity protein-like surface antigen